MRPFIHINCAMSADGKIAGAERKQVKISSKEDRDRVKGLRMKYDAILVGVGTIASDDPHLTVTGRPVEENQIRIVIDPNGRTPDDAQVLDDRARTIIVTDSGCTREWGGAETVRCPGKGIDLEYALNTLYSEGIHSILVEGGGTTIASFFTAGAVDEYSVYVGDFVIGGSDAPTPVDGDGWVRENGFKLTVKEVVRLGEGVLIVYVPAQSSGSNFMRM